MLKKNLKILFLTSALLVSSFTVKGTTTYAANSDKYAYSYGMVYDDDIDTSNDAINAASDFGIAGYNSYNNTKPTWDYVTGNNPETNKKRIQSSILFFSGHGAHGSCQFKPKNTSVHFHITSNYVRPSTSPKSLKLSEQDLSKVNLMTFASCNSASAVDKDGKVYTTLIEAAVNSGARCAVGWADSVSASAHSLWLKRYTNELATGRSVEQAINYANGWRDYGTSKGKRAVYEAVRYEGKAYYQIKLNAYRTLSSDVENDVILYSSEQEKNYYKMKNIIKPNSEKEHTPEYRGVGFNNDIEFENEMQVMELLKKYTGEDVANHKFKINRIKLSNGSEQIEFMEQAGEYDSNSMIVVNLKNGKISSIFNNLKEVEADIDEDINLTAIQNDISIKRNLITEKYEIKDESSNITYDCDIDKLVYSISFEVYSDEELYSSICFEYDAITGQELVNN